MSFVGGQNLYCGIIMIYFHIVLVKMLNYVTVTLKEIMYFTEDKKKM